MLKDVLYSAYYECIPVDNCSYLHVVIVIFVVD